MAAPLRQIYDQMLEPKWVIAMGACASSGGMFNNYTILQGVDRIVPVDIYVPVLPAAAGGADGGDHPPARGAPGRRAARVRPQAGGRTVNEYEALPGFLEQHEAFGETTVTIEPARVREACEYARDELGFRMLVDLVATDYLGWGAKGVSGYIATRDRARHQLPRRHRASRRCRH